MLTCPASVSVFTMTIDTEKDIVDIIDHTGIIDSTSIIDHTSSIGTTDLTDHMTTILVDTTAMSDTETDIRIDRATEIDMSTAQHPDILLGITEIADVIPTVTTTIAMTKKHGGPLPTRPYYKSGRVAPRLSRNNLLDSL